MTLENQPPADGPLTDEIDLALQRLLGETVGATLDAKRGNAAAAFARAIGVEERRSLESQTHRRRELRRLRMWAGAASALAACLSIVVALQAWIHLSRRPELSTPGRNAAVEPSGVDTVANSVPVMDQQVFTRDLDGGTIILENSPMRVVRRQTLKRTRWFDPGEQATYSVTEPVERVGYVPAVPY